MDRNSRLLSAGHPGDHPGHDHARTDHVTGADRRRHGAVTAPRTLLAYFSRAGENYYYGGRRDLEVGNTELLAFMNEFIAKQKANGTMPELQKKWFGEAFTLPVSFTPEF